MPPTVGFVIPAYKRDTLAKAIDSVYSQIELADAWRHCSVTVADDCSPQHDREIYLNQLQEKFPNARIYRQPRNLGMSLNLYNLLEGDRSDYIFILTDDDYLLEGSIYRILQLVVESELHQGVAVITPRTCFTSTGELVNIEPTLFTRRTVHFASRHLPIRVAHMAHVLSGMILKRQHINFETWHTNHANAYFPLFLLGHAAWNSNILYSSEPLVGHTINNEVYWSRWGKDSREIENRLFRDYHAALDVVLWGPSGVAGARPKFLPLLFLLKQSTRIEVSRVLNRSEGSDFSTLSQTLTLGRVRLGIHCAVKALALQIRLVHKAIRRLRSLGVFFVSHIKRALNLFW